MKSVSLAPQARVVRMEIAQRHGANDNEFYHHIHPGDVLRLRMLAAILDERPDSALAPYLDFQAHTGPIACWRGLRHLPTEDFDAHA